MRLLLTVLIMFTVACDLFKAAPKEDEDFDRYEEVRAAHQLWLQRLHGLRHSETTWPVNDCDAWIWAGKAVAAGATGINLALSEYPGEPGLYGRRPPRAGKWCWQDGHNWGSASTWSGDMFKCGMLIYGLQTGNVAMLEAHRAYGRENSWKMGDPATRDEVYYKPNLRGWLSRAVDHLGGPWDDDALIPDVYIAGQTDYKAHLQMCGIWAYGVMEGALLPSQVARIDEHYARAPHTLFYSFMHSRWVSGDYNPVADALLADPVKAGEYVRCGASEPACQLAEKAWVAALLLELQ